MAKNLFLHSQVGILFGSQSTGGRLHTGLTCSHLHCLHALTSHVPPSVLRASEQHQVSLSVFQGRPRHGYLLPAHHLRQPSPSQQPWDVGATPKRDET